MVTATSFNVLGSWNMETYPDENYIRSRQEWMNTWSSNDGIIIDAQLKGSDSVNCQVLIHFLSCPRLVIIGALDYCIHVQIITHCGKTKHLSSKMIFEHIVLLLLLCGAFIYLFQFHINCRSFAFSFFFLPWNTTNYWCITKND